MSRPSILFLASIVVTVGSGCGTVLNLRSRYVSPAPPGEISIWTPGHHPAPKLIYGGVLFDAGVGYDWIQQGATQPSLYPVGLYLLLVDLPMSAIGDTATLPVTVPASLSKAEKEQSKLLNEGRNKEPPR